MKLAGGVALFLPTALGSSSVLSGFFLTLSCPSWDMGPLAWEARRIVRTLKKGKKFLGPIHGILFRCGWGLGICIFVLTVDP